VEPVPTTQNTMSSGQVVQNNPVMAEAKFVLRYDDIRSSSTDALPGIWMGLRIRISP